MGGAGFMYRIGAGTTLAQMHRHPVLTERVPLLAECCRTFANALVRNRATLGGNLVNAAPCADTAPALLVLDAEVELQSVDGVRRMPLSEFLMGAFETKKEANELLTAVTFAMPPAGALGGFRKMGLRKISCMAKVDVAVMVVLDEAGACLEARIAHGAASAVALRVPEAEAALVGGVLSTERIDEAARLTETSAQPRSGSEYKRQVVHGLTRRLLAGLSEGVSG